ncbi:MAG: PA14 domain-containing protein [Armatimonadota bacterium]
MLRQCCLFMLLLVTAGIAFAVVSMGRGTGLQAQYYDNADFTALKATRVDGKIDFTWPEKALPLPEMEAGAFAVRWTGFVQPKYTETYTFLTRSVGAVRLWVNGKLLVDNWTLHEQAVNSGAIDLEAGKLYDIRLSAFTGPGAAAMLLGWSSESQEREAVPTSQLYLPIYSDRIIAYMSSAELKDCTLYRTTINGEAKAISSLGEGEPSFNRDGTKITYTSGRNVTWGDPNTLRNTPIYVMNADGSKPVKLTRNNAENRNPVFSPDGGKVAFASYQGQNWAIWQVWTNGTHLTKLTDNANDCTNPVYSPDGKAIAYQSKRDDLYNIFLQPLDGSAEVQLTTKGGREPSFSRDGQLITFVSDRDGNDEIYLMKADGSEQLRLTDNQVADRHPVFAPASAEIIFTQIDDAGKADLFAYPLELKQAYQLTDSGQCANAAMALDYQLPTLHLQLWLTAARSVGLTLDGTRVTAWQDQSPYGNTAVQASADQQPEYRTMGINGMPALYFNGNNSNLTVADIGKDWDTKEGTLFVLFAPDNDDAYTVVHQTNTDTNEYWRYSGDGNAYFKAFRTQRLEQYPLNMPTNAPILITALSGSDYYYVAKNGVLQDKRDPAFLAPQGLVIGMGGDPGPLKGYIAEIAYYSVALSEADRVMIEQKMMSHYQMNPQ